MDKLGTIRNISGFRTWSSASLCQDEGIYFLVNNNDSINLTDYLQNINFEHHTKTSVGGVLARTALGGIAGVNWAKGNAGISGAAIGLGSAINTEYQNVFVTLTFIDGDFIQGQTDLQTATLLEAICGQSTGEDRVQRLLEEQKYSRLLDDAPRTYYEVRDELQSLENHLSQLNDTQTNGASFEVREDARHQYIELEEEIDEKKAILKQLEFRAKATKAFGNFDTFNDEQAPSNLKIIKLQDTLYDVKLFKKWHFYVLLIAFIGWVAGLASEEGEEMATFYFGVILVFISYYITRSFFRMILRKPRENKLTKLQKEYDEKYCLDHVTL